MPGSSSSSNFTGRFFCRFLAGGVGLPAPRLYLSMRPPPDGRMDDLLAALEVGAHASTCSDAEVGAIGVAVVRILNDVGLVSLAVALSESICPFFITEPGRDAPPRDTMRLLIVCLVSAGTQSALSHLPDALPAVIECVYTAVEVFLETKIERRVKLSVGEVCAAVGCDAERLSGLLGAAAALASQCSL